MGRLHEVPSDPEEIIDRAVNRKKLLNMPQRFEAAHVALPLAGGLVRDCSPVVRVLGRTVLDRGAGDPVGRSVAPEFIGNQAIGDVL